MKAVSPKSKAQKSSMNTLYKSPSIVLILEIPLASRKSRTNNISGMPLSLPNPDNVSPPFFAPLDPALDLIILILPNTEREPQPPWSGSNVIKLLNIMDYDEYRTNDGLSMAFQTSQPLSPLDPSKTHDQCILLLHGFSGSSQYFTRNYPALSARHWVIAPDMRGHGSSSHSTHGYHVARLAMDLHDLIGHLKSHTGNSQLKIIAVGCSIGAAIVWTYVELFGSAADFAGLVFVDQAPLQDRSLFGWGPAQTHKGLYDEATMIAAQQAWTDRLDEAAHGLVYECLGYRHQPVDTDDVSADQAARDVDFFVTISKQCRGEWLAKLIADHTRYDHREAIELIKIPALVMAGRRSGCFTVDGMFETARRAKGDVFAEVFESGHWLFYEQPDKFNERLLEFVDYVLDPGREPAPLAAVRFDPAA